MQPETNKPSTQNPSIMTTTTGSSNKLNIYLARHGQDEDNAAGILNGHRDQPLTQLGIDQAQSVAAKIRNHDIHFDAIYASSLQRAHKTAEIIAQEYSRKSAATIQKVITMDTLKERDLAIMTGTPAREITQKCAPEDLLMTDTINYFLAPPGAETFPRLIERNIGKA